MKQPHQHIADTFPGKSGSAYQGFKPRPRPLTAWDLISTACVVVVFFTLLLVLPWQGGW